MPFFLAQTHSFIHVYLLKKKVVHSCLGFLVNVRINQLIIQESSAVTEEQGKGPEPRPFVSLLCKAGFSRNLSILKALFLCSQISRVSENLLLVQVV